MSHYNIDVMYENMNDYVKTRSFYEHAVDIRKRSLPLNILIFKHIEALSTKCKKILINIFCFKNKIKCFNRQLFTKDMRARAEILCSFIDYK